MATTAEVVLAEVSLFEGLDAADAAALRSAMSRRVVPRGHVIFMAGQPGNRLFVILDGKVKITRPTHGGRENLIAVMGPGEVIGELSLFDPGPRTSTATAVTECELAALDNEDLRPWLTERPAVALQLLTTLARRLRRTNEAMADLVYSDVPGRVAKALLDLGSRFGEPARGKGPTGRQPPVRVHHDLTQEELAQLVGASRETVNKALADFSNRGWIRLDGRTVIILDRERLARRGR